MEWASLSNPEGAQVDLVTILTILRELEHHIRLVECDKEKLIFKLELSPLARRLIF